MDESVQEMIGVLGSRSRAIFINVAPGQVLFLDFTHQICGWPHAHTYAQTHCTENHMCNPHLTANGTLLRTTYQSIIFSSLPLSYFFFHPFQSQKGHGDPVQKHGSRRMYKPTNIIRRKFPEKWWRKKNRKIETSSERKQREILRNENKDVA